MQNINTNFPDAHDLLCFREIASTLNISRAAERVGVGQPALSLSLKRLEKLLGTPLFLRRHRGLSLTPAGTKLLNHCNKLQESWEHVARDIGKIESDLSAIFRIGCHTAVALYTLTPFLKEMHSRLPDIEFRLSHGLSRDMCEAVIAGSLDFAFAVNPVKHPDLVIRKLATDEIGLWGTPGHVKNVVIFDSNLMQTRFILKKEKQSFEKYLDSNSLEVIASLAEAGVGAAILPTRIAEKLAPSARRLRGTASFKDEITFIYRYDLPKSAATSAVIAKAGELRI